MDFLPEKIAEYTLAYTQSEPEILSDLNRNTWAHVLQPRMLSGHLQGRVLAMLSKMIQPKNILEIGTYTGYSALCLAEGLQNGGILHTIEINDELKEMANEYFKNAGMLDKIQPHIGCALKIVPTLNYTFDLVFIDADKINYSRYYDLVFDKVKKGGYIIADNVLWSGNVLKPETEMDDETKAIAAFNKKVHADPRIENVIFPIRDGLMVMRKI